MEEQIMNTQTILSDNNQIQLILNLIIEQTATSHVILYASSRPQFDAVEMVAPSPRLSIPGSLKLRPRLGLAVSHQVIKSAPTSKTP